MQPRTAVLVLLTLTIGLPACRTGTGTGRPSSVKSRAAADQAVTFRDVHKDGSPDATFDLRRFQQRMLEGDEVTKPPTGLFPSTKYFDLTCGAVLVSKDVVLTAAHCVERDPHISFAGVTATCEWDKTAYTTPGEPGDVAVCLLDKEITNLKYETIDAVQTDLAISDPIMLTGIATNSTLAGATETELAGVTALKSITAGLLVTEGGAWVKKGDSGMPAFSWKDPSHRRVVAVNGDEAAFPKGTKLCALPFSKDYLSHWTLLKTELRGGQAVSICGLDGFTDANCHP
jgi:hypothetical protein